MKNPKDSKKLLHSRAGNFWQRIRALWDRYSNEADHSKGWLDTGLRRRHRLNWIFGSIVALGFILFFGILIWLKNAGIMQIDESRLLLIIDYKHADNTLVFDRRGEKIGEFFSDYHVYIPYEKIPTQLVKAVISIEDRHYFEHHGIDMRGIVRALLASLRSGGFTQGGSTITQQVVRNFLLSPEKKFERKIKEALLALELEQHLSKEKILEIYLNALFLGQGAYGVGAAAERHFGRPLAELETHELALIAGLFQSPSRYNPHKSPEQAKRRQRQVLKAMVQNGYLSQADYKKARSKPLIYKSQNQLNTAFAPNFIDAVQELTEKLLTGEVKGKGLRIYTTLDLSLQQDMNEVIKESTPIFSAAAHKLVNVKNPNENMIEAASIILDHSNGDVLAMTGGRDYARSQFNRALKAKRAPGSSFKPAVYAAALMGGSKWSDQVYVSPIMIQDYRPANYADEFLSEATLYSAFYQSINTPVVELGYRVGTKKIIELAHRMGIHTELKNQAGTLLGGSELTPMDMASFYATIGNRGQAIEPRMITRITDRDGKLVYSPPPATKNPIKALPEQISYLLIDGMRAVFKYGTANRFAAMSAYAAGKTGTTDEAKDTWFCGLTPRFSAVVWVGTDSNLAFSGSVAGSTLALPIWAKIVEKARLRYPGDEFPIPEGIKFIKVNSRFGYLDPLGLEMPFIDGHEPTRTESALSVVRETGNFRDYLDR